MSEPEEVIRKGPPTALPWRASRRNWRNEEDDSGNLYVTGGRHFSHDEGEDGEPCRCTCDGDRDDCDCLPGCGWVETSVAVVCGNATSGGVTEAVAEYLVAAANEGQRLLAERDAAREEAGRLREALAACVVPLEALYCVERDNATLSPALHAAIADAVKLLRATVGVIVKQKTP